MGDIDWQALWQSVEAVGTGLGVVVLVAAAVVAVVVARRELSEARRTRHAQAAIDIYRELRSQDQLEGLREIYKLSGEEVPAEMEAQVGRILDRFELLGVMVVASVVDEELALRLVRGGPLRCWYKLRGWIREQRKKESGRAHFARHLEYYAHRSLKYQYEKVPEAEWTHLYGKNLVHELKDDLLPEREPPK